MLHFLRKNKCFYCKKVLKENFSVIKYGSVIDGTVGEAKICDECAKILDGVADYDEDTL